jgi:hypothetical protein
VVAEQTPALSGAGGVFRALIPERTTEDVLSGRLRMYLGDEVYQLRVLTIEQSDAWRELVQTKANEILTQLGGETNVAGVLAFMGMHTPTLLELVHEYDVSGVLPDDQWIYKHCTEADILRAFMLCMAAAYPFVTAALEILAANPQALRLVMEEFGTPSQTDDGKPITTSQEPSAGPSPKRARRSRTSSSSDTSKPPSGMR